MKILIPSGEKALPVPEPLAPSPFLMIFALAVTAIIMGVTVFVLLRAPITIAKTGKAVTTKAARSLEPLATHGKPLPPKEKRKLTATLIKFIKLLLVLVPVGVGLFTFSIPIELPYEIVIIVCGVLAALSVFWFSAQYIFAAILGVKPEKLV